MTPPLQIDSHMHLYPSAEQGRQDVASATIDEYGKDPGVRWGARAGTLDDGLAALADAGVQHGWVLNTFDLPGLPQPPGGARHWSAQPPHAKHARALADYNAWVCEAGARNPQLLPFVTTHPGVLSALGSAEHIAMCADKLGAQGVKLHNVALRTFPDDPALEPLFGVCTELELAVVVHCGPDSFGAGWAALEAFAPVLERHPRLRLVLAHLGGGSWRRTAAFAEAFPQACFDLSEIISWLGASQAPTAVELVELIRAVGVERVLAGSDFPWYEPAEMVDQVLSLPGLSASEHAAVLGDNAARLTGLT